MNTSIILDGAEDFYLAAVGAASEDTLAGGGIDVRQNRDIDLMGDQDKRAVERAPLREGR